MLLTWVWNSRVFSTRSTSLPSWRHLLARCWFCPALCRAWATRENALALLSACCPIYLSDEAFDHFLSQKATSARRRTVCQHGLLAHLLFFQKYFQYIWVQQFNKEFFLNIKKENNPKNNGVEKLQHLFSLSGVSAVSTLPRWRWLGYYLNSALSFISMC